MLSISTKVALANSVKINYSCLLPITAAEMWGLLKKAQSLRDIGEGFVTYGGALPDEWYVGFKADIKPRFTKLPWSLLSLLPEGMHIVEVTRVDPEQFQIETKEFGGLVKKWNHSMKIEDVPNSRFCVYSDTITIEAGWATRIVARLADKLYRHRHKRWLEITTERIVKN